MNRDFYQKKALRESSNAAKQAGLPLSIWPNDTHHITLEHLPVVLEAFPTRRFAVKGASELQARVEVGKRYGLLGLLPTVEGRLIVGEWE